MCQDDVAEQHLAVVGVLRDGVEQVGLDRWWLDGTDAYLRR